MDGVVDLCQSFNDEESSRKVVHELEAYAEKYGSTILGLIHTNKYNDEARRKTPRQNAATNQKKQMNEMRDFAKKSITGETLTTKKGYKEQVAEMRKAASGNNI